MLFQESCCHCPDQKSSLPREDLKITTQYLVYALSEMLWVTNISLPTNLGIQLKLCCSPCRMMCVSLCKAAAVVLLDLSAAFDTIYQNTFLDRLSSWFGICWSAITWFRSYLTDHFQCIKIGPVLSNSES